MNKSTDKSAARMEPRGKPDAALMLGDIRDALREARNVGLFERLRDAHRTRRCWWENQRNDGRVGQQSDKTWVPWKGAIDSRVPLAHLIVSELTMLQMTVFTRGDVEIKPRQTAEDLDKSNVWGLVFQYYLECQMPGALLTLKESLRKQLRLLFDAKNELGYALSRVRWRKRRARVSRTLTPEQLTGQMAAEALEQHAPEGEELPPELGEQIYREVEMNLEALMLDRTMEAELVALIQRVDADASEAEAKKVAAELRKGAPEATYYVIADAGGVPEVRALVPWLNCGHTLDLTDDGGGSAFFVRELYSKATLEAIAEEEDWNPGFVEAVLQHPNVSLFDADGGWEEDGKWVMNGTSFMMEMGTSGGDGVEMYEVLRRTGRAVDGDGLETIYETVLHGSVEDQVGRHVCLSQESHEMMFVTHSFEPTVNAWLSRGVPEILLTMQAGLKKLYDAETCRAEITSVPPLQVDSDNVNVRPMPGIVLPSRRTNNQFLSGPTADNGAHRLRQELKAWADELFYRGGSVDPELKRAFREDLAADDESTVSRDVEADPAAHGPGAGESRGRAAGEPGGASGGHPRGCGCVDCVQHRGVERGDGDEVPGLWDEDHWGGRDASDGCGGVHADGLANV